MAKAHISMLSAEGDDGNPAKGKPVPRLDDMGRPVAAIMALGCYALVAFELFRKVCTSQRHELFMRFRAYREFQQ
jgi:hypothetical protein